MWKNVSYFNLYFKENIWGLECQAEAPHKLTDKYCSCPFGVRRDSSLPDRDMFFYYFADIQVATVSDNLILFLWKPQITIISSQF